MSRGRGVPVLLAAVSLLPHLPAIVPGRTYFFRDFGMAFYPLRAFIARELAAGRWPFWNPYLHEGLPLLSSFYAPDLLHVLLPSAAFVSWLLTLHYPLAAVAAYLLARDLGMARAGAAAAGVAYAMGGLAIACLNLYLFLEGLAWAPLVALGIRRAAVRGGCWVPGAALLVAVSLTTAPEFAAQAMLLGVVTGLAWDAGFTARRCLRALGAVALGVALAGVPVALTLGVLPETLRGRGAAGSWATDFSLHPAVLLQVLVRDAFGSLESPLLDWWGHRFFTQGFPYFMSLYLGPQAIALSAPGLAALSARRRWLLLVPASIGLWYALGPWGGLSPLLSHVPVVHAFRYPSKAVWLPYIVLCLLAGGGLDRLSRGGGWKKYGGLALGLGGLCLVVALLAWYATDAVAEWMWSDPRGNPILAAVLGRDATFGVLVGWVGALLAAAVVRGALRPELGAWLVAGCLAGDLSRAGSGLNPQTSPRFFDPLPGLGLEELREPEAGRLFSFGTDRSPAFAAYLRRREPGGLVKAYFVKRQTLYAGALDGVETAAPDASGFGLTQPLLWAEEYEPDRLDSILARLRSAAVTHILSLDPLSHADLSLLREVPTGVGGLTLRIYRLARAWPRAYVACRIVALEQLGSPAFDPAQDATLRGAPPRCQAGRTTLGRRWPGYGEYDVDLDDGGYLVVRDTFARGWRAVVDGSPAAVIPANGRHLAVPLPGGRHRVVLSYHPPGLGVGVAATLAGVLVSSLLAWRGSQRPLGAGAGGTVPA